MDRQISIQTFTPGSRAENRENYKGTSHLSEHPRRGQSYMWYHTSHSQRQFGNLILTTVPKLQGEPCWQPDYVARVLQVKEDKNPLTCTPYGQSVQQPRCYNAIGQLPMTGHRGWHQTRRRRHSISGFPELIGCNCEDTWQLFCDLEHLNQWPQSKEASHHYNAGHSASSRWRSWEF